MAEKPMTPEEFDEYMDGVSIQEQNRISGYKVDIHKDEKSPADKLNEKLVRLLLRLLWLAAWGWQVFTFGWPSALLIKVLDKKLAKGKEDGT